MVFGMWKKLKAVQMREGGADPKALARSRNKMCRSSFPFGRLDLVTYHACMLQAS